MVKYHPDVRFLTDYTAGCLPTTQALCVATHLHYCTSCKAKVRELTELGSILFMQQQRSDVKTSEFERLLTRVETLNGAAVIVPSLTTTDTSASPSLHALSAQSPSRIKLPKPLLKIARGDLESLQWRSVGKSFRYSKLKVGNQKPAQTTLMHIRAGGYVPHHRHEGDEITVVLTGSFSDQDDKYNVGDFIVRTTGEQHQPVASQNEDCLCLSSLERPIVMSNWFYRVMTPLM